MPDLSGAPGFFEENEWKSIANSLKLPPKNTFVRINTLIWTQEAAKEALQTYIDEVDLNRQLIGLNLIYKAMR